MTKEDELTAGLRAELARVDARLAQVTRPQNCGTGYCSCVECVVEPAMRSATRDEKVARPGVYEVPVKTYHDGKPWPVAPKPWVGLSEKEIQDIVSAEHGLPFSVSRAIEAKLREKNGGAA
jgi:hypothetical protein